MSVTLEQLADFTQFAQEKLLNGGAESFEQLLTQWRQKRELSGLINDIEQSEADIAAGRTKPLDQAFSDIREKLGWKK